MNTARSIVAVIIGMALVWAAPGAPVESSPAAAQDRTEPTAPGTTALAAPPKPKRPPQPGSAPTLPGAPERGSGPTSGRSLERGPGATPEPSAEPGSGATPEPSPERGPGATPEPSAERGPGATPGPSAEPGSGATPEPTSPPPTGRSPTGGSGEAGCFLTSGGFACPGNPPCVVTSTGVTCGTDCVVTSVGLACPRGDEVTNPPQGEVLPGLPVSGGPKPKPKPNPTRPVKSEGEVKPTVVSGGQESGADQLPFTGAPPLLLCLGLGCGLLASGLLLRRRTSTVAPGIERAEEATPFAVLPGPSPRKRRLPPRRAIVLPSLALVACGMLLRGRMHR